MISNNALEIRSASSRFSRTEALPMNMNPASVVAVAELLARLVELLRSSTESRETVLSVGPLQLDLLTRTARRGERMIDLLPREFVLAEYMMRRQGQVLTRAVLLRQVWNYKFIPKSNLVDVHMGRLRPKLHRYSARMTGSVIAGRDLCCERLRWQRRNAEPLIGLLLAIGLTVSLPPLPSELSTLLRRAR